MGLDLQGQLSILAAILRLTPNVIFFFSLSPYRKHLIPQIPKFALVKFARCHGTGLAQIDFHLQFEDSELHDICFTDTFSLFSRERDPAATPAA